MTTAFPTTLDSFINPTATDKLNGSPNPALLHSSQHTNLNDTASALEAKVGIDFSNVNTSIDYALQIFYAVWNTHPKGRYKEIVGPSVKPSSLTWYIDSSKTVMLVRKSITYNKVFPTTIVYELFDGTPSNVVKRTVTDTLTYSGAFVTSRDRSVSP